MKKNKTKRTRPIANKLGEMLNLVNLLPKDADERLSYKVNLRGVPLLPIIQEVIKQPLGEWSGVIPAGPSSMEFVIPARKKGHASSTLLDNHMAQQSRNDFAHYILELPEPLQQYIGTNTSGSPQAYQESRRRYDDLVAARDFLMQIAKINAEILSTSSSLDEEAMLEFWRRRGINDLVRSKQALVNWSLDDKGCPIPHISSWLSDLSEGLEVVRIRQCPICSKLFWAGRVDKSTCPNEKCGWKWRKRLQRSAWQQHGDQYRDARKKKIKKSAKGKSVGPKRERGN